MSRERLEIAHRDLAGAVAQRQEADAVAARALIAVQEAECQQDGSAVAAKIREWRVAELKRGNANSELPSDLAQQQLATHQAREGLVATRSAYEHLLGECANAKAGEQAALREVALAAASVLADESAALARDLSDAKSRAAELDKRLRALTKLWIATPGFESPKPIQLPAIVAAALAPPPETWTLPNQADPHFEDWQRKFSELRQPPPSKQEPSP